MTETLTPIQHKILSLQHKVLSADNLPSLPVVAIKVLELTEQPDVSTREIAEVVQNDPALSAKILKMANSSMFGMAKKVVSMQQAMVLLGLRTVKIMVLSFSLADTFSGKSGTIFDFSRYWRRSISMAVGAKLLADAASKARRDEAFVGGLLADLGMVAAFRCAPDDYAPVLLQSADCDRPIQEIEKSLLGQSHAEITAAMLKHWHLPDVLCEAVAAHHGEGYDGLEDRTRLLAGLLWAAALIADLFCEGSAPQSLDDVKKKCVDLTGISNDKLETILEKLDSNVTETASMLSLDIGQTTSYEELRTRAMMQLAAVSMDAEISRVEATRREESARHQIEEMSDEAERLRRDANTDALTKLANRKSFEENIERTITSAREAKAGLGLIMLDIDHFKRLNDTYGHQAGDEALRKIGQCLGKISDSQVLAARYGGEEFAVIVQDANPRDLRDLAQSIRKSIELIRFDFDGQPIQFTASLGAAQVSFDHERPDAKEIIQRADQCLYQAKENGRNRVEVVF